jgi:hypothetical protein
LDDWDDFGIFLKKNINLLSEELIVASSNGIGKAIRNQVINSYQQHGMEIIGKNHCQNITFDNIKSLEFLRGNRPTWEIFRFNELDSDISQNMVNPLVRRDLTKTITEQVDYFLKV